ARLSDNVVRQDEFAEVAAVEALVRPDARLGESARLRVGVRVERRISDAAAGPESATAHFVRVRFTRHAIGKVGDSARMLRRRRSRKARDRQIEGAPEEMHGAALADEAGAELFEPSIRLNQGTPE